ncbi:MAG: HEAT repeat domain-containing protein [Planctomycetota bacterium]|jgi:hypothetical protein
MASNRRHGLTTALVLTGLAVLVALPAPGALAGPVTFDDKKEGGEAPDDPVAEAESLRKEGKEFFNTAGDTELSRKERKNARIEAYRRLTKAKKLLDDYLEENPDDSRKLNELYSDISTTMFWIRKEAGVGELDEFKEKTAGGNFPSSGWGKPPEDLKEPSGGTSSAPDRDPSPGRDEPDDTEPAVPVITAATALEQVRAFEKKHPGDIPGLHQLYTDFLARFPDRGSDEYAAAVERLEVLGKQLKDVYRLARDDDPDSLKDVDDAKVKKLIAELAVDLKSEDSKVRERAARYMAGLGSGEAAPLLLEALESEGDDDARDAIQDGLAKIGGRRTCTRMSRVPVDSDLGVDVLEVFRRMVALGGVNARIAGSTLAEYVAKSDDASIADAGQTLFEAGIPGALGLSMLVKKCPVEKKVEYLQHLGEMKDPRTASHLCRFLRMNPKGAFRRQHKAARKALETIGKPGVRYMIPVLEEKKYQTWTAEMLRTITGAKPRDDKLRTWKKWFRKNYKKLEGK